MTVNEVISLINGRIKNHDDSQGSFTDQYIWGEFTVAKNRVIGANRLRRFNYLGSSNRVTFCIELEPGVSHECGCVSIGCSVMKSIHKIPARLSGRNNSTLKVTTLGGIDIPEIKDHEYTNVYQYNDMYKDKPMHSIVNERLILWNTDLTVVQVSAIWENVLSIDAVQYCSDATGEPDCIDVFAMDAGIDGDILYSAIDLAVEKLMNTSLIVDDLTNDASDQIRQ